MDLYEHKPRRRVSLFFPFLLITVGIVLLWQTLGEQQSKSWDVVLRLWPLLLIFGGIDGLIFQHGAAANTFWITLGLALLLSNFNRISWTTWEILLSLWPVFLVALGVDMVFNRKSIWNRLAAGIIVLLLMGGIVVMFDHGPRLSASEQEKVVQERGIATQGVVILHPIISFLKVYAQGNQEMLVDGRFHLWEGEKITRSYEVKDGTGTFTLNSSGIVFIYEPGIGNRATWEIGVSSRIPISLQVNQAIGETTLDLTELQIERLDTSLALGRTSVVLPSDRFFKGKLVLPIGEIVIEVPAGTAIVVEGRPVIGSMNVPPGYLHQGSRTISPAYEESAEGINLSIDLAIGQIIIRER